MFEIEANWVGNALLKIIQEGRQIECLNLGSSTKKFREHEQPFIYEHILRRLEGGHSITHCDMKDGEGVDLVGDLADPIFFENLIQLKFDLILCNNLLMHMENPGLVYSLIQNCLRPGGHLILTTPTLYPYCGDPIDSKYRPSPGEIIRNLPALKPIKSATLVIENCHAAELLKDTRSLVSLMVNLLLPVRGFKRWRRTASDLLYIFENYRIACVLMVKND